MATAMGTNTISGTQAASVGRRRLKPPSDWQARLTIENDKAAAKQMPIDKKTFR